VRAGDLSVAEREDQADLVVEFDAGRPSCDGEAAEHQDRISKIADFLDLGGEAPEGLTAVLDPGPSHPLMATVGGGPAHGAKARRDAAVELAQPFQEGERAFKSEADGKPAIPREG
jgi:hypothetical protein